MTTRRAAQAFEAFKGERPTRVRRVRLPDYDQTGWEMGPLVGIAYEARRDGKTAKYFHEFKHNAGGRLVSRDDGRQLYIEGGRYKVTERGIEDMPNLMVVNPSPRSGKFQPARKGVSMARPARRRRRRPQVSIFTTNPRRRRRRAMSARRVFARNPRRRAPRRRARSYAARSHRIYRRNPSRRRRMTHRVRRYRRNPVGLGGVGKLSSLMLPAIFIGAGAVAVEIAQAYLPIPLAWKTGPMRYVVKAGVGIALGLVIAKGLKQKRLGYYFAAGAVAISVHDFLKGWLNSQAPGVRGLGEYGRQLPMNRFGFVNPGSVVRFNGMNQYGRQLRSQFGGAAPDRVVGGEMNFAA